MIRTILTMGKLIRLARTRMPSHVVACFSSVCQREDVPAERLGT